MSADFGLHWACPTGEVDHDQHTFTTHNGNHFTTANCGGWGITKGTHVTIGQAKTVWVVEYVLSDEVEVFRVNAAGKVLHRYVDRRRVQIVGRHQLRQPDETATHCSECGCYRELADRS